MERKTSLCRVLSSRFLIFALLWMVATAARAELLPEQVAVLVSPTEESRQVATHYVLARNLPEGNVLILDKAYPGTVSRQTWNDEIRPQIKTWLESHPDVRCLVCCWDLPLKIGGYAGDDPAVAERSEFLKKRLAEYRARGRALLMELYAIAPNDESRAKSANLGLSESYTLKEIAPAFTIALQAAHGRIATLPESERAAESQRIEPLFLAGAGVVGISNLLTAQVEKWKTELKSERDSQQTSVVVRSLVVNNAKDALLSGLDALESLPESTSRDAQILRIREKLNGQLGTIAWLETSLAMVNSNESTGSFDSELALIFDEPGPLIRWVLNPSSFYAQKNVRRPTMMVARLEAPSVEIVLNLIDTSVEVEKNGLSGTIYLDARTGRPEGPQTPGSYEKMEQSLNDLGKRLAENTDFDVRMNTSGALFKKEECDRPAALYCGWYALASYQDTFTFSPGAVAYHVASSEAESLRGGSFWCPNLLKNGAVVTCGPVFEPYLAAFPEPDEFYSLLLTGKYTVAECYQMTAPTLSWAMTCVGDPLYNPFKNSPKLTESQLPETLQKFLEEEK